MLQDDPTERNTLLLEQLLVQGYNISMGNPLPSEPPTSPSFSASAIGTRVNILFFLSLSISLASVFLGIVCLQWLREFQVKLPMDPRDSISIRQMRWEGLTYWKVPEIIDSLPILLNLSLLLFLAGLLDLLWSRSFAVAIPSTIVVGMLVVFFAATTVLPSLQLSLLRDDTLQRPQCPYKSPQSWIFHRFVLSAIMATMSSLGIKGLNRTFRRYRHLYENMDWTATDIAWNRHRMNKSGADDLAHGLAWINTHLGTTVEMVTSITRCIRELLPSQSIRVLMLIDGMFQAFFDNAKVKGSLQGPGLSEETPELLSALYLEKTKWSFPQFDTQHIVYVIRVLNTQLFETDHPPVIQPSTSQAPSQMPVIPQENHVVFPFVRWPVLSNLHQIPRSEWSRSTTIATHSFHHG